MRRDQAPKARLPPPHQDAALPAEDLLEPEWNLGFHLVLIALRHFAPEPSACQALEPRNSSCNIKKRFFSCCRARSEPCHRAPSMAHEALPAPFGRLRPYTSPLEREPTALSLPPEQRPATSFPATGFDAELERLESDDAILRQMAMNNLIAMAKHGGSTERVVAMMIERLDSDSDKLFRALAVEALSRSAKQVRQEVTSALVRGLQDPDANVRCRAAKALRPACVGPSHPVVVAALSAMLQDESPFVQDAAVDNLQYAMTQASFEVRQDLLASVHKGIRAAAIDSFIPEILSGGHQALDLVIGMLKDPEFRVRVAALGAVAKMLTTRDDKVVKEHQAKLKADGVEPHEVAPAKAEGPLIDKCLAALISTLDDESSDIRTTVLRVFSCNTAILNQHVFKAVFVLLSDVVDGTRAEAKEWVSKVVAFRLSNRDETAYNAVLDLLKNSTGATQLSAAWIVSKVVATGNTKYLKDVVLLLENDRPLTRVAGLYALLEAVKNVVPSIMWSSSGAPTVPRCLHDPDRRYALT